MKLTVLTSDAVVTTLCREVLHECLDTWEMSIHDPSLEPGASDVYLWEFRPGLRLPFTLSQPGSSPVLVLVSLKHLPAFRAERWRPGLRVLLKPVTRVALRAFLMEAARPAESQPSHAVDFADERAQLVQFLLQTNIRLQQYDHERTAFLGRVVHDFRAPLTAITGFCGLLLAGSAGPLSQTQREIIERTFQSANRLTNMSSALLQLSLGGQASQAPTLDSSDLRDCIQRVLSQLAPLTHGKNIRMCLTKFDAPTGTLYFEGGKIEQTLVNLLENAGRFAPRNSVIELSGYPYFWERRLSVKSNFTMNRRENSLHVPNAYRVDVCDSGPGIPPEHAHKIFEEYSSYEGAEDRSGTGLGLAICKLILEQHKGHIWADSSSEGTRFSFVLPLTQPAGLGINNSVQPSNHINQ